MVPPLPRKCKRCRTVRLCTRYSTLLDRTVWLCDDCIGKVKGIIMRHWYHGE